LSIFQLYQAKKTLSGEHVPVFDIAELYSADEPHNMLVSNATFGAGLAAKFTKEQGPPTQKNTSPDHSVVLMKKHGFTTLGSNIPATVFRALYTQTNAGIQTNALLLQRAVASEQRAGAKQNLGGLEGLSAKEARDCQVMNEGTQERPWELWVREVEACPLYVNKMPKAA
jgi:ribulose-5-phosphate 4-epimerase/fuculose-1-phosphate aldolase